VAALKSSSFTVAVIPQTLSDTNLSCVRVGSLVHIEVDMFARYVHRMIAVGVVPKEVL
jgi:riboflavin synthase alpha subunit